MLPSYHTKLVTEYVELYKRCCGTTKVRIYSPTMRKLMDGHLYLEIKNNYVENIYLGIERNGNESSRYKHNADQLDVFRYAAELGRYKVNISGINNCARFMMGPAVLAVDAARRAEIRELTTAILNNADKTYADLSYRQFWKDLAEAAVQLPELETRR